MKITQANKIFATTYALSLLISRLVRRMWTLCKYNLATPGHHFVQYSYNRTGELQNLRVWQLKTSNHIFSSGVLRDVACLWIRCVADTELYNYTTKTIPAPQLQETEGLEGMD